jgi:hypothetical protein
MKKLVILFIAITPIFLTSCGPEAEMWQRTYQIKNESGYDIEIRFYENFSNQNFEDIVVLNGQFFRGDKIEGSNFDALNDTESIRPRQSFSSFSIIIIYENERRTESSRIDSDSDDISDFFSEPINRNLLRDGNYTHIGNDIYEFILTEEDYNNATPCEGDCLD